MYIYMMCRLFAGRFVCHNDVLRHMLDVFPIQRASHVWLRGWWDHSRAIWC